ncbi:Ricin B-like lectin R40G3 [Rhynchospora pubera]|uniref:Ricin B-like lectin R40G3 n=1 Tax=Rhynchospora pubera TaxID=906938 RepID=A0AAV8H8M0_9POAL|nr:Ricin B-like lectin R40G3 [Rhynchospora pubera]
MSNKPTFLIINQQADENYCLIVRTDGKAGLALYNPGDPYQRWIKEEDGSVDSEGQPAFALRNVGTNELIKGGDFLEIDAAKETNSLFWTESKESEQGFRKIRPSINVARHMTPTNFAMTEGHFVSIWGGVHPTTQWKIAQDSNRITISCKKRDGYNLTIRDEAVVMAPADPNDKNQIWMIDFSYAKRAKDQDRRRAFAIVNKGTGQAISHGLGIGYLVHLAELNRKYFDASFLWTDRQLETGFREIRMQSNTSAAFHALYADEKDSEQALLALRSRTEGIEQRWKFKRVGA